MAASALCHPEGSDRRFRPCRKGPAFRRVATPPQALAGEAAGKDIAYHLSDSYVSACDLSSALGRLFSAVARCSGGSSDPPARWPRAPLYHPEDSEGSVFRRCISAKPSSKPCTSPSTNTSKPTAPILGAKPSAPLMNSLPITCRLIPHRRSNAYSRDAIGRIFCLRTELNLSLATYSTQNSHKYRLLSKSEREACRDHAVI